MKQNFAFLIILLALCGGGLFAQDLSIVLDSTINYTAGAGEAADHSFGFEQFANLRFRVRGERATFISAFNLIAVSGNFVEAAEFMELQNQYFLGSTPFIHGQNYAAAIELERLYFRVNSDLFDTEAGLLRMAFGYSQVWGPSDFLNPRNPLSYNARPRGVLGTTFSFYPADSMEFVLFAATPKNPFLSDGGGLVPGFSLDRHWSKASLQALYAFHTPMEELDQGLHRFGLSVKADMELGFVFDALYTLNPANLEGIEGLSLAAGFDYSFLGGDLYVLAEYLFNGNASASALGFGGNWANHHYLFASAIYRFNDFCSLTFATVLCLTDLSFSPFITLNYELFQGFSLNLTARIPLDQDALTDGRAGELGPVNSGARFILNAGARLRF